MPIIIDPQNPVQNLDYNTTVTEVIPVEIPLFDDDLEIIQKLDDEPNDVGGLTAAALKAKFDEGNLTAQTYINNVLIPQVVADDATEQARQLAESERVANEIIRVANEGNRILRETARDTNELARQQSIAKVQNMTASATTVPYGTPAVATITTDPDTGAFNIGLDIPQGKPGTGNGDMEKAVYDPNNKSTDIFEYVDNGLAGKAPAGFGLGGACVAIDHWDNATENGWYVSDGGTPGSRWLYGQVIKWADTYIVQKCFYMGSANMFVSLERIKYAGVWQPWEYVNPPMAIDEEYRTTERYLGKPVYVMLFNFGALPNQVSKTVVHGIANVEYMISATASAKIGAESLTVNTFEEINGTYATGTSIVIKVTTNLSGWTTCYVLLKYIKTTD